MSGMNISFKAWLNKWKTAWPIVEMPTDRSRIYRERNLGTTDSISLSIGPMVRFSEQHGVSVEDTLLAAWLVFSARMAVRVEVLVGLLQETGELVPFPIVVDMHKSFPAWVQEVHKWRELAHCEWTAGLLNEAAIAKMVPMAVWFGRELQLASQRPKAESLELGLTFEQTTSEIVLHWTFDRSLFEEATIQRMQKNFLVMLERALADSEVSLKRLPLVSSQEKDLLDSFRATAAPYPNKTIQELFEEQVVRNPKRTAVRFAGQELTYEQLEAKANSFAHALRGWGLGRENRVALLLDHPELKVVSILGTLKAGCAYVPIDPDFPQSRIDYLLEDCQPSLVVTQNHLLDRLANWEGEVFDLNREASLLNLLPTTRLQAVNTADDLAYVIYTSGSTGKPKGTMLNHRGVINLAKTQADVFCIHENSVVLQFASFSFDASVLEIFLALLNGGTLVMAKREVLRDPTALTQLLEDENITFMLISPSMLSQLPLEAGPNLECIASGGEVCPSSLATKWMQRVRLVNAYGPTETTVTATAWSSMGLSEAPDPLPIGKPLPNCEIYILDAEMQEVPIGVQGEIYIGGDGVARGYLNRPELTEERFVAHPSGQPRRLYKTGDVGRYLPDGNIEFLGRTDDQIKIRGYRVELQEIESVLLSHGGLREAVVLVIEENGSKQLAAYAVPRSSVSKADVWAYLRRILPDYMLPGYLVFVPEFPRGATGKVDRKALPRLQEVSLGSAEFIAPRTETEQILAEIWQEVLQIKAVGVKDHFFEVGGHSLNAVKVMHKINSRFGVAFSSREIFEKPTIEELAQFLDGAEQQENKDVILRLPPQSSYPLSPAQTGLWHFAQLEPENTMYNIPLCFELKGELDEEAFVASLQAVIDRHAILQSSIELQDGQPMLVMKNLTGMPLERYDWSGDPELESKVKALQRAEINRVFDLQKGPLFQAHLVRTGAACHLFLFNVHHLVFDGWSTQVLLRELDEQYRTRTAGMMPEESGLSVQYVDFAVWQNERLVETNQVQTQRTYWMEQLREPLPVLELPTDFPRPAVQSYRGKVYTTSLSPELRAGLQNVCHAEEATMFTVVLAAFKTLLHRYTGQDDLIVGTTVAARTHGDVADLIGMFVNTLVLRTTVQTGQSFKTYLRDVRDAMMRALEHQEYPFERLVQEVAQNRDRSRHPIFSVMVAQEFGVDQARIGTLDVSYVEPEIETSKFDLTLFVREQGDSVLLQVEYATDLFEAATIESLMQNFKTLLGAITADVSIAIAKLPISSPEEREQLLFGLQEEPQLLEQTLCIQERFEKQVAMTPDAVAVTFEEQSITYAELNAAANRVAHALRKRGVSAEDRVLLMLERSVDMIAAILGVVKAGGAYVPVDPAYPSDRIRYMLEDSGAKVVVTETVWLDRLHGYAGEVLTLDGDRAELESQPIDNPVLLNEPHDLLYIIYTSGSTGYPKGVMIEHANLGRLMDVTEQNYGFGPQDVWTMFHSYCFDFSVWEMYGALLYGGRLAIVPKEIAQSGEALLDLLVREKVTVLNQTPSSFYRLLDAVAVNPIPNLSEHLRYVIFGGEALNVQRLRGWMDRYGDQRPLLVNMYGITETTVHTTYRPLTRADLEIPWKGSPIGKPLRDLQIYLLDKNGELAPLGAIGEIYVAGPGLARSYLNNHEKTAEVFVPAALPELEGVLLYKTGDLARYNRRGELEHLGRIDHQVKVRGFRIELGEIEVAMSKQDGVRGCVATVQADASGENRIVVYVETDMMRTTSEWRALIKQQLPEYMLPSRVFSVDRFPLTSNGKLDLRALLKCCELQGNDTPFVAPRTDVEKALAQIWQEVLNVECVGIHDNFFEIGGHSLNVARVVNRVKHEFGVQLSYRDIFEKPTVAEIAELIPVMSESGYAVAFDFLIGDEMATFYLTKEEYEEQGIPEGAVNIRRTESLKEARN